MDVIALAISIITTIASVCAIVSFILNQKHNAENEASWKQRVDDEMKNTTKSIESLSRRVDSHNNYAKMFAEYGEDIAYIRGLLDQAKRG